MMFQIAGLVPAFRVVHLLSILHGSHNADD
jgi:hypothetical protein